MIIQKLMFFQLFLYINYEKLVKIDCKRKAPGEPEA